MEQLVKVKCIKHVYPDKTEVCLCGLDFIVNQGDKVIILGPNGAGKTTLLSHILGLLSPIEGSVEVLGMQPDKSFSSIRRDIGVVFQNVDEQIIGPRVYDDIGFTARNEGLSSKEVEQRVLEVARSLEIEDLLEKIPHYLSGGQKKKVALAGAIVMKPKLLIMDEPFDGLDPKSKTEMVELLNRLNSEYGITLIVTTHDINIVPKIASLIYVIRDGRIVTKGDPGEVFNQIDQLRAANLEPPILTELFYRLKERGILDTIPSSIDQAEDLLADLIGKKEK